MAHARKILAWREQRQWQHVCRPCPSLCTHPLDGTQRGEQAAEVFLGSAGGWPVGPQIGVEILGQSGVRGDHKVVLSGKALGVSEAVLQTVKHQFESDVESDVGAAKFSFARRQQNSKLQLHAAHQQQELL